MRINPRQPILFDTDQAPGKGTGMWQVNPFFDDEVNGGGRAATTPFEKRVQFWFAVAIGVVLFTGAAHMILA